MNTIKSLFQRKSVIGVLVLALIASLVGVGMQSVSTASAAGTLPCDAWTCVAAHSTVRALKASYSGNLYQVKRASNGATLNITTLAAGGYANGPAQDTFCSGTTCTIVQIYDQSGRGNHLGVAPAGGVCGPDTPANATNETITIEGHKVYSLKTNPGNGYRDNTTSGIPTGSQSAGSYAVFDGGFYNSGCCYDYGNAETNNLDTGDGDMGAIYFGNATAWGRGAGSGPWVMADLENGLFAGGTTRNTTYSGNAGNSSRYVSAFVKNSSTNYAIRAGNGASGGLSTWYSGLLPNYPGYRPLALQGAIILGIGGDNSCSARGTFYEGAMTAGMPSDASENTIQANLASVYSTATGGGGGGGGGNCTGSVTGTFVSIINRNSGKVLDVQNSPVANNCDGANVGQYTNNGGAWQKWKFVASGSNFTIVAQNSGKCLDVQQPNTADGANVGIWTCNGGAWQVWQKITTTAPYYRLVSVNSGKVLDVANCGTGDGVNVQQWTWLNNNCQQWSQQ